MRRNPEQFFDVTIQPLLFTAMFAYIFGGAIAGRRRRLPADLIPGILAQTVLTACIATGIQLREDMDKGVFDRFKSLPIARIAPLAGPMVADLVRYAIAATLTFATGIVMGYRPGGGVARRARRPWLLAIIAGWSLAWIFTWFGTVGPQRPGGAGHLADDHVPADVPVQRVRPGRHAAAGWLAGVRRRSTRSRTSSPRCATWPTTARHRRGRLGRWSAASRWSRSSRRCRCGASPGRCDPGRHPVQHRPGLRHESGPPAGRRTPSRQLGRARPGARLARPASASAAQRHRWAAAVVGAPLRDHQQAYAVGVLLGSVPNRSAQAPTASRAAPR